MRKNVFLWGAVFLFAAGAGAQGSAGEPPLLASSVPAASAAAAIGAPGARASRAAGTSQPDAPQRGMYGVFETYDWQAYAGYTFFRFYEVPGITQETNGFNLSLVYYHHGGRIGAEGEMVATYGSQWGTTSKFLAAMGGLRYRFGETRRVEWWAHGLAGGSHFLPQTAWGGQSAFAYEAGVGVDLNAHRHRIAYRVSGDMVGTRYFSTYQYSPKISAGIVLKF